MSLRVLGHNYANVDELIDGVSRRINDNDHGRLLTDDDIADMLYVCDYARYMRQNFPTVYAADGWWGPEGDGEPEWALDMLCRMQAAMNETVKG